ncbi:hypothetical protein TWF481_009739 [Arthrobotrys musiformis]|uniref:NACHT domain-containing protein n=1 Tax=Arthrobotrys musiformis TaxID=47236 RepID=A0AAV9W6I6_9PEZI
MAPSLVLNFSWSARMRLLAILFLPAVCCGAYALVSQRIRRRRIGRPDGIVMLYPGEGDDLDIVAVHGLGANPETTWTVRHSKSQSNRATVGSSRIGELEEGLGRINWLRDEGFLRTDFKRCRVLSFAYNADWLLDATVDTAKNRGHQLLRKLNEFRERTKCLDLLLGIEADTLEAYCRANRSNSATPGDETSPDEYLDISQKTAGIIFLGTPHEGSEASWIAGWLAKLTSFSGSDAVLLSLLEHHSSQLSDLRDEFSEAVASPAQDSRLKLYSFFETKKSYPYGIPLGVIVGRDSATLERGISVPISKDHSGLNKCKSRDDILYKEICTAIRGIRDASKQRILRNDKVLRWIGGSDYHGYISQHKLIRMKLHRYGGLGTWLLKSPQFGSWENNSSDAWPVFWLRGGVGTGKSCLSSQVIEWFRQHHLREEQHLAYYYCSENVGSDDVLRSLVLQLALSADATTVDRLVADIYDSGNRSKQLEIDTETYKLLEKLVNRHTKVVIVVDGLDECKEPLRLLQVLHDIQVASNQKLKLFLSSRMHIKVEEKFRNFNGVIINEGITSEDMARYIDLEVRHSENRLLNGAYPDLENRLSQALTDNSQGMFRWVELQLAIFFSEDHPFEEVEDVEREISSLEARMAPIPSLNAAYHTLYIRHRPAAQSVVKNVFRWLLCSIRPLTSAELTAAVLLSQECIRAQEGPSTTLDGITESKILRLCSNFVVLENQSKVFQFAHFSVREYLLSEDDFVLSTCHSIAAETCLWHIYERGAIYDALENYTYYAWIRHCSSAGSDNRKKGHLRQLLEHFCRHHSEDLEDRWLEEIWREMANWRFDGGQKVYGCTRKSPGALFIACAYNLEDVVKYFLQNVGKNEISTLKKTEALEMACGNDSYDVVRFLINEDQGAKITEDVLKAAVMDSSKDIMLLVLDGCDNSLLTYQVIRSAIQSRKGADALRLIKARFGGRLLPIDYDILDEVFKRRDSSDQMLNVILDQENFPRHAMSHVLKMAAYSWGPAASLLEILKRFPNSIITEDILEGAAGNQYEGHSAMEVLLKYAPEVKITEPVLRAAVYNNTIGPEILELLFKRLGGKFIIPPRIVQLALENYNSRERVVHFLLEHHSEISLEITEGVVSRTAANSSIGREVIPLLLRHIPGIPITEDVLMAAASNEASALEILETLLRFSQTAEISPRVLSAAVANESHAVELIELLLKRPHVVNMITDEVMKAAASNEWCGDEVVKILLVHSRCLRITSPIIEAAAANWRRGGRVLRQLFEHDPEVQITDHVMETAARVGGVGGMRVLLCRRAGKIPETWLKAAAENPRYLEYMYGGSDYDDFIEGYNNSEALGPLVRMAFHMHMIEFLLAHDQSLQIPETVMRSATCSKNHTDWYASPVPFLLRSGRTVEIAEDILVLAAGNRGQSTDLTSLLSYDIDIPVTERVLVTALGNENILSDTVELLLKRSGMPITHEMLKIVASTDHRSGRFGCETDDRHLMKFLFEYQHGLEITEDILEIAAANARSTKEIFDFLLDKKKESVRITETILIVAARNPSMQILESILGSGEAITISDAVLVGAAGNQGQEGFAILVLLLKQLEDLSVTKEMIEAAEQNKIYGSSMLWKLCFYPRRGGGEGEEQHEYEEEAEGKEEK